LEWNKGWVKRLETSVGALTAIRESEIMAEVDPVG
jgi:hypothetical protein